MKKRNLTLLLIALMMITVIVISVSCKKEPVEEDTTCVVTFDTQGATTNAKIDPVTIDPGKPVARPKKTPKRTGYVFLGWFSDKEGKNAYDFKAPVNESLTIYAVWANQTEYEHSDPILPKGSVALNNNSFTIPMDWSEDAKGMKDLPAVTYSFAGAVDSTTNVSDALKAGIETAQNTPGFFAFLHTFGRDLKWNPHIHILIAELKLGNNNSCVPWKFFDYDALSMRFQRILLNLLSKELGKSFNKLKKELFINYSKGFYVYAEPKEFKDFKSGVEYVTRYCGRVPISENRIVNYDSSNVTFSYIGHNDNKYHEVTVPASQFIMILLRHLLPSQFKIIRYYGFYRKKHSIHSKMFPLIKHHCRNFRKQLLKYEVSISMAFHRNPYNCPKCDTKMNFVLSMI